MTEPKALSQEQRVELVAKAKAATPGPWFHCQPSMVVPKQRTIHGPVPARRVDYVSTWADMGTPPGHRVVHQGRKQDRDQSNRRTGLCRP